MYSVLGGVAAFALAGVAFLTLRSQGQSDDENDDADDTKCEHDLEAGSDEDEATSATAEESAESDEEEI